MNKKGFTLIELSIVLVIIGLLVGGVMGGQALVQQAKLQKLGTELNQYKIAFDTFKMQYNAIPGDMPNAIDFWPDARSGNGDGKISLSGGSTNNEDANYWHHLSQAGLVNGKYNAGPATPTRFVPGVNCPETPFGGCSQAHNSKVYNKVANYFSVGLIHSSNGWPGLAIMTPKDHFSFNSKFDNGDPSSGNILATAAISVTNKCVSADAFGNTNSATYRMNESEITCRVFYKLD